MPSRCPTRLHDLDPDALARAAVSELAASLRAQQQALGLSPLSADALTAERTLLYRRVAAIAAYAVTGRPLSRTTETPSRVVAWIRTLLHPGEIQREPRTPLELALAGALAREKLDRHKALSASELALLAGYDRDSILGLVDRLPGAYRAERIKNRPWRFRVTPSLLAWLRERDQMRSVA